MVLVRCCGDGKVRDSVGLELVGGIISYDPAPGAQGELVTANSTVVRFPHHNVAGTVGKVVLDPRFPMPTSGAQCLLWGPRNTLGPHFGECHAVKCSTLQMEPPTTSAHDDKTSTAVCIKTSGNYTVGTPVSWSLAHGRVTSSSHSLRWGGKGG